jgi:hypothetical protein
MEPASLSRAPKPCARHTKCFRQAESSRRHDGDAGDETLMDIARSYNVSQGKGKIGAGGTAGLVMTSQGHAGTANARGTMPSFPIRKAARFRYAVPGAKQKIDPGRTL